MYRISESFHYYFFLFISMWFQSESKLYNGSEKDSSASSKLTKKESLKVSSQSHFITNIMLRVCFWKQANKEINIFILLSSWKEQKNNQTGTIKNVNICVVFWS